MTEADKILFFLCEKALSGDKGDVAKLIIKLSAITKNIKPDLSSKLEELAKATIELEALFK